MSHFGSLTLGVASCLSIVLPIQLETEVNLIAVDSLAGTVTFDWYIYNDTCIYYTTKVGEDVTDESCPLVNIFLDT